MRANYQILISKKSIVIVVIIFLSNSGLIVRAQQEHKEDPFVDRSSFSVSADYLVPTRFTNQIRTASLHALYRKNYFKRISVLMSVGVSTTYAWGYSRQWHQISDSLWQAFDYPTSAFGAGPLLQIEHAFIKAKNFWITAEASGSCLLYTNRFPYGGDLYNFMIRTGPSFVYKIKKKCLIKIGYRWMHVSNGQGVGNQNPFYEGYGFNISLLLIK
jgi:hypothetical protein